MPAGRPFQHAPPLRPVQILSTAEMQAIAPLNNDGVPDLYNYLPTRLIPLDEAKARGWLHFYQAELCRYGHSAPRYVANHRQCVDCFREKKGKQLIGAAPTTANAEYKRPYKQREVTPVSSQAGAAALAAAAAPIEPDRMEKLFLVHYAEVKDLDAAAIRAGMTAAQVIARLSWSQVFSEAVTVLEDRLGISHIPQSSGPYAWDNAKRDRLIEVFVDTGDIATARDSIRVTPSEYFREIAGNPEFSAMIDDAMPLAILALEERATQLALGGNDKLLTKILTAKKPEYRDNLKIDLNVTEKNLTDDQLNAKLTRLLAKSPGRIIDSGFVEPQGEVGADPDAGGSEPPRLTHENKDLL